MNREAERSAVTVEELETYMTQEEATIKVALRKYISKFGITRIPSVRDDIADELFSETYLTARDKLAQLRDLSRLPMWVNKIALNLVRTRGRKSRTRMKYTDLVVGEKRDGTSEIEMFDLLFYSSQNVELTVEKRDLIGRIFTAITRLHPSDRAFMETAVRCQMSGKQIAQALDIPPGTARSRLNRTLRKLKKLL